MNFSNYTEEMTKYVIISKQHNGQIVLHFMAKYTHETCQVKDLVEMLKSTKEDTLDLFRWCELLLQKYL